MPGFGRCRPPDTRIAVRVKGARSARIFLGLRTVQTDDLTHVDSRMKYTGSMIMDKRKQDQRHQVADKKSGDVWRLKIELLTGAWVDFGWWGNLIVDTGEPKAVSAILRGLSASRAGVAFLVTLDSLSGLCAPPEQGCRHWTQQHETPVVPGQNFTQTPLKRLHISRSHSHLLLIGPAMPSLDIPSLAPKASFVQIAAQILT